jgi:predicted acyltransferase
MPIIKKIWTSSYVLVAGGYSCVLVGLFSLIVDVFKFEKWAIPFIWIGANPLAVYLAQDFIAFEDLGDRIAGGPLAAMFGSYAPLVPATATVVCVFLFARFLYKRQIFLRV